MRTTTWIAYVFVGLALCHVGFSTPVVKRQTLENPKSLDPAEQELENNEEQDRGKRKVEGAVELTFGAKNAVLGLFFNKINSFLDQKTAWINQLDQLNVAKNRQYGIESPKDPITSFGNVFGSHTYKQLLKPIPFLKPPFFFRHKRAIGVTAPPKRETTTEDIVLFTPGQKVELQVPSELFGSGFSVITNVSQIVGNLMQSTAERTAKIFEAMKPFLQGVFGVKSLTITRDGPKENQI